MARWSVFTFFFEKSIRERYSSEAFFKEKGEPLFSSHMVDLSEESVDYNISTTKAYLQRAAKESDFQVQFYVEYLLTPMQMKQLIEMEIVRNFYVRTACETHTNFVH
jgi:hypothetical protein